MTRPAPPARPQLTERQSAVPDAPSTEGRSDRFPTRAPDHHEVGERHPALPGQVRPLLTPDDVHHKWFTTARLREGYDLGEVDSFLLDVEITLDRLYRDNAALRAERGSENSAVQHDPAHASRVMALADTAAGQALAAACTEAGRIVGEAQDRAARIEQEAHKRAQYLDKDTAERADQLERQLRERQSELQALASSRRSLERQLSGLRSLVAEYRGGVRITLDEQFADRLDAMERHAEALLSHPMAGHPIDEMHLD
nr:DivIVA domain-containing protein [Streptomyces sp. SID14478]